MINITPNVNRLKLIDQNLQNINQLFMDSMLIDRIYGKLEYSKPNTFNECTYSQMILNMKFVITICIILVIHQTLMLFQK